MVVYGGGVVGCVCVCERVREMSRCEKEMCCHSVLGFEVKQQISKVYNVNCEK